jgi:tungstate transport system substrate-binding protein
MNRATRIGLRYERASTGRGTLRAVIAAVASLLTASGCAAPSDRLTLATTTSVDNSGLLAELLPAFRADVGIDVKVAAVGSGIAIDLLKRGQADVVISHAPAREAELIRDGSWIYRKLMFNDFVLVGPLDDPAGVAAATTVEEAMRRIALSGHRFISRGDSSGTHERERDLWRRIALEPRPGQIVVAGSGMGATLRVASATRAYTLSDRATFSQHASRANLRIVFEGGPLLLNTYAVIARGDSPGPVRRLLDWLTDGSGRRIIADYRTAAGVQAFNVWPAGCARERPEDLPHRCS